MIIKLHILLVLGTTELVSCMIMLLPRLFFKLGLFNQIIMHLLHLQEPSPMLTVVFVAQEDSMLLKDSLIPMLAIFIRLMSSRLMAVDQLSSSMEPATTWTPTRTATPSTLSQETVSPVPTPTTNSLLEPVSSLPPAILDSPW